MRLQTPIQLPAITDLHVHLRQDPAMVALAVNAVREGGTQTAYVMPNLTPPLTTAAAISAYATHLYSHQATLCPDSPIDFLFTLYLHPSLTAAVIAEAASLRQPHDARARLVHGVKAYPAGVTTNSAAGVTDFSTFYPILAAMQEHDLIFNIHGETPGASVLDAEAAFIPTLLEIHERFPRLRIVLEHMTSKAALDAVLACGPNVRCTITAHHLLITTADWAGVDDGQQQQAHDTGRATTAAHNWCKPAAKSESDRIALIQATIRGGAKVMFGSDSAPHPSQAKQQMPPPAGCFTQAHTASLVLAALEEGVTKGWLAPDEVTRSAVEAFLHGRAEEWLGEYWKPRGPRAILHLDRTGYLVPQRVSAEADGQRAEVTPFAAGRECLTVVAHTAAEAQTMDGRGDWKWVAD